MSTITAPRGLGKRGRAFWRKVSLEVEFTDPEGELLLEVCRCLDTLDSLNASVSDLGPMVQGSAGQMVVNPAVSEARQQRLVLHRLLSALNIPEDEVMFSVPMVQSAKTDAARKAANVKWNRRRA